MRRRFFGAAIGVAFLIFPNVVQAQDGWPDHIRSLHQVLDTLFAKILPKCSELIAAAQAIAGFGSIFYIGYRVWKHIANAEPIDFFPLLRPFALSLCIMLFPQLIAVMNGILEPTKTATQRMVDNTNSSIEKLMAQREKELKETIGYKMYGVNDGEGDRDVWMQYTHEDEVGKEGWLDAIGNDVVFAMQKAYYGLKTWFKDFVSFLLQLIYEAAALCINTMRTFNLLICALFGPFVFAIAVFDGFQHSLTVWLARYINFYLWLPIANILAAMLGTIQEEMIKIDIELMQHAGETYFTSTDIGYSVFMIIGIACYFCVPNLSNMIVNAGSGSLITSKASSMGRSAVGAATGVAGWGAGMAADAFGDMNTMMTKGHAGHGQASGYFGNKVKG